MRNKVYGIQLYKLIDVIEDATRRLSDARARFGELVSAMKRGDSFKDFGALNMSLSPIYAVIKDDLTAAYSDVLVVWGFVSAFVGDDVPRIKVANIKLVDQRIWAALRDYYEGRIDFRRAYARLNTLILRRTLVLSRLLSEGVAKLSEAGALGRRSTAPPISVIGLDEAEEEGQGPS